VLAYVWEYAPVTAKFIAQLSGRPKARIERIAALLAELNLIHRGKTYSSHDWVYDRGERALRLQEDIQRWPPRKFLIHESKENSQVSRLPQQSP
jgi:hypothetical protein